MNHDDLFPSFGGNLRICGALGTGRTTLLRALALTATSQGHVAVVSSSQPDEWRVMSDVLVVPQIPYPAACSGAVVILDRDDTEDDLRGEDQLEQLIAAPDVTLIWTATVRDLTHGELSCSDAGVVWAPRRPGVDTVLATRRTDGSIATLPVLEPDHIAEAEAAVDDVGQDRMAKVDR